MAELSDGRTRSDRDGGAAGESSGYTLVTFGIPVEEFALQETLIRLPDAEFACDRTVQTPTRAVMPLVWARGVDRIELEPAFVADPSVQRATLVEGSTGDLLYRMEWESRLHVLGLVLSAGGSLFRDARGTRNGWTLRVLYPSRRYVSEVSTLCESLDVAITIDSICRLEGGREDRYGLTRNQREALVVAQEMGYFEIPRAVDLDAVAAELGLSHQSLSERLRRAHDALVRNSIGGRNRGVIVPSTAASGPERDANGR